MTRLVLALALLTCASLPARAAEPRPPAVTVVPATRSTIAETIVVTGTLVPREEVLVSPQIEGLAITEILVEEGDTVVAGQVLARLSQDALRASIAQNAAQDAHAQAAIAQARGSIAEAEATRAQADAAFARTSQLIKSGVESRETFDTRQAASQTAAARADAAKAALAVAEADRALAVAQRQELMVRLARTEITAPVGGIVSRRTARLGSVVGMTGDPLFRIISDGAIELEADVPESQLAHLRPGQHARLDVAGGAAREGDIRLVSPEVSRVTRLGRVRIAAGKAGGLVIGSFARAVIEVARHDGVLVPLSAVLFTPEGDRVQVVRDGTIETRPVTLGLRAEGRAEITDGLAADEGVVAVSGSFVRDGDRVTPVAAKPGG